MKNHRFRRILSLILVAALLAEYDVDSKGGNTADGRKVKGTIHWVSAEHAIDAEVRLFDRLFSKENPEDVEEGQTFLDNINPDSLQVLQNCKLEPELAKAKVMDKMQFERLGYFCVDKDSTAEHLVFNRACTLKDSWSKESKK